MSDQRWHLNGEKALRPVLYVVAPGETEEEYAASLMATQEAMRQGWCPVPVANVLAFLDAGPKVEAEIVAALMARAENVLVVGDRLTPEIKFALTHAQRAKVFFKVEHASDARCA